MPAGLGQSLSALRRNGFVTRGCILERIPVQISGRKGYPDSA